MKEYIISFNTTNYISGEISVKIPSEFIGDITNISVKQIADGFSQEITFKTEHIESELKSMFSDSVLKTMSSINCDELIFNADFQDDVGCGITVPTGWSISYKKGLLLVDAPGIPGFIINNIDITFNKDFEYNLSFAYWLIDRENEGIFNHICIIKTNHRLEYPVGHDECIVKWIAPVIKKLHGDKNASND